ncbi:hypothetical protein C8J57DRAFT_1512215 [Mycena rebaudengoi]|nr:hypothetical protein C8J57DRAFT_1512215 [Mycena rebaudengoi]
MADFDISTLDDIVSDPLVQLKNPTPSTPAFQMLEDIWHVKDWLLRIFPHDHSAFKPFAAALKLSTFVYDRNDRARVEEVLNKNNETWNDVSRKQTAIIHRRVRRYIPPPTVLVPALTALFILGSVLWADWWLYTLEKAGWHV